MSRRHGIGERVVDNFLEQYLSEAVLIAAITAVVALVGHAFTRSGRAEEVAATRSNNLLERQGEQIDRLTAQQDEMLERIDKLESSLREASASLEEERHNNRTLRQDNRSLRSGLSGAVESIDTAWDWIENPGRDDPPPRPSMVRYRRLIEEPRPRRPPPASQ